MTTTLRQSIVRIEECEEPEIQYLATKELFDEIHVWLAKRGGVEKIDHIHQWLAKRAGIDKRSLIDSATYYDTHNYRLLREGIEYRVKNKGEVQRHDMKLPRNAQERQVLPDENDILWRNELNSKPAAASPA